MQQQLNQSAMQMGNAVTHLIFLGQHAMCYCIKHAPRGSLVCFTKAGLIANREAAPAWQGWQGCVIRSNL